MSTSFALKLPPFIVGRIDHRSDHKWEVTSWAGMEYVSLIVQSAMFRNSYQCRSHRP